MMSDISMAAAIQVLSAQFAAFQALLLAASAIHKALRWRHSWSVVRQFAGAPASLTSASLAIAVACELTAAVLLIVPSLRAAGAMLAALIWAAYLVLILRAIWQDRRHVDCGCSFGSTSGPLGFFQVTRNAVLTGLALLIAAVSVLRGGVSIEGSQLLGACALMALYGALDQVMALQPLRSGEVS
jgi:hypothetical protein